MRHCHACGASGLEILLDLGAQPVSSHFTQHPGTPTVRHPMALAVCKSCALVQLERPFPFEDLVPPFDWITYREPEAHLDAVVERIASIADLAKGAKIVGLTYKDRTTLERLERKGLGATRVVDARRDLGATHPNANIETVHGLLTPERAKALAERDGTADLLLVRHILEHAANGRRFLEAVGNLVHPGGLVVIEVPDVVQNLERQDYAMLWEEHMSYFLPATLQAAIEAAGLELVALDRYDYRFEDISVAYARKPAGGRHVVPSAPSGKAASFELARSYAAAFQGWTERYQKLCQELTRDGRRLAAYGAGHLTVTFIELHGLARYFAFVADDTPHKQGLHLPRSGLPILPGSRLDAGEIAACFMGFTPEVEDKVIAKNQGFADAGGKFISMFVDSPRSLRGLLH